MCIDTLPFLRFYCFIFRVLSVLSIIYSYSATIIIYYTVVNALLVVVKNRKYGTITDHRRNAASAEQSLITEGMHDDKVQFLDVV